MKVNRYIFPAKVLFMILIKDFSQILLVIFTIINTGFIVNNNGK